MSRPARLGHYFQVEGTDGSQSFIELIDERFRGRVLKPLDIRIRDILQILDDASEAGAMGSDERRALVHEERLDVLLPIGEHAGKRILETLTGRNLAKGEWS